MVATPCFLFVSELFSFIYRSDVLKIKFVLVDLHPVPMKMDHRNPKVKRAEVTLTVNQLPQTLVLQKEARKMLR